MRRLFFCPEACYAPAMRARQVARRAKSLAVQSVHSAGVTHTEYRSSSVSLPCFQKPSSSVVRRVCDNSIRHDWRAF